MYNQSVKQDRREIIAKIQNVQLDCLKEVKRISKEHQIKYCLAFGSMLGAVRHKGFIPWDDDLDIFMPFDDVKKLSKYLDYERFFLQTEKTDPQIPFVFYKLRRNNTLMIEPDLRNLNIHHGIWIDIFIYVKGAKTNIGRKTQYNLNRVLQTIRTRWYNKKKKKKGFFHTILSHIPDSLALILDRAVFTLIKLLGKQGSLYYFVFNNENFEDSIIKKEYLDNTIEYPFEDTCFLGIKKADEYLKSFYGEDYMTPKKYGTHSDVESVRFDIE